MRVPWTARKSSQSILKEISPRCSLEVLLDYGCMVVHIFSQEAREFYALERLWKDGKPLDLSGVLVEE